MDTPMVPSEPELSICRGCVHVISCAATIWWMPTPVVKIASSILPDASSCSFIRETTLCADRGVRTSVFSWPSSPVLRTRAPQNSGIFTGNSRCRWCMCFSQDSVAGFTCAAASTASLIVRRNCLPVACTKKVGLTCLAFSDRRMSTWMMPPRPSAAAFFASGRKSEMRPVIRSSKREPTQSTRSDSCTMKLGVGCPCMPSMFRANGCRSSKVPSACKVVATGICSFSAKALSSAGESLQPWPAMITGFSAVWMRRSSSWVTGSDVARAPSCASPPSRFQ
mmetsp:Transcript_15461/g.27317  ORF Transcript_15461/g.27317 Transcript_15461/m.27317 type:complete len:280 (-) Transcript_15461:1152-1991(-)